jgi:hypothetical protein
VAAPRPPPASIAQVRRPLSRLLIGGAVGFLVASCGSAAPSAADYRKRLDTLCASLAKFNRGLPQLQHSQHLTLTELEALARQEDKAFRSGVASLTPAQLSSAHRALIGDLGHPPAEAASRATVISHARLLLSDYTALGATGCATSERQAVAAINALPSASASAPG